MKGVLWNLARIASDHESPEIPTANYGGALVLHGTIETDEDGQSILEYHAGHSLETLAIRELSRAAQDWGDRTHSIKPLSFASLFNGMPVASGDVVLLHPAVAYDLKDSATAMEWRPLPRAPGLIGELGHAWVYETPDLQADATFSVRYLRRWWRKHVSRRTYGDLYPVYCFAPRHFLRTKAEPQKTAFIPGQSGWTWTGGFKAVGPVFRRWVPSSLL